MSDYLSKPIDLGLLYSKLAHWAPREGRTGSWGLAVDSPATTNAVLDEADALSRTHGNTALYERLLRKFREREADTPQRLADAVRAGDGEGALRTVHNLKGIAATIGAQALSQACLVLETELRQPSDAPHSVEQATQRWKDALTEVLQHLSQRVAGGEAEAAPTAATPTAAPLPPQLLARCRELQVLLQGNDAHASRSAEALAQDLQPTTHAEAARQIARHAGRFDYDAALEGLQTLMASLA